MKPETSQHEAAPWTHYWTSAPGASACCLPELPAPAANHIQNLWWRFFDSLPADARLLDLGTGGGAVLLQAKHRRPDLHLTGVDYATTLPDLGAGFAMFPGTRIENLSFADNCFDAVTGQFAVEYASLPMALPEIQRVLTDKGALLLLCHHADGVIVKENLDRLTALRGLLAQGSLFEVALTAVRRGKKSAPDTRKRLARLFDTMRRKYPRQTIVQEVAVDIARLMSEADSLGKLVALRREVAMEGERINALRKAALTENQATELTGMLSAGQRSATLDVVYVPGVAMPFAWRIHRHPQPPPVNAGLDAMPLPLGERGGKTP
ncbi:MAG: class I SAM-dependent methyltransferase [Thermodesulfobacteriota bacterium]